MKKYVLFALIGCSTYLHSEAVSAISANPGAVKAETGTGALGRTLGISADTGIRIGGLWIGDLNYLISGGLKPRRSSGDNLVLLNFNFDSEKLKMWKGGLFEVELLQFNGRPTNEQAGSVQGYNGLIGPPPRNRFELFKLWYRQELFNNKCVLRIGKLVPSVQFTNVIHPVLTTEKSTAIPATTGLIYTPIFVNSSMRGVLPGYYNSAYGISATVAPTQASYLSYGAFDGSLAKGKQTGLRGPHFNSYYFHIAELGFAWKTKRSMYGKIGIGAWAQSGKLSALSQKNAIPTTITEHGTQGAYLFGSQRIWRCHPGKDNSGIVGFGQFGANNSKTLPVRKYYGAGLTFLGLLSSRLDDSFGAGFAWSRLNRRTFVRKQELMWQGYYQLHLFGDTFLISALSYIPRPGAAPHIRPAWAVTARIIALF